MRDEAESQLKQACRLTGATWAALVTSQTGSPTVKTAFGLSAAKTRSLEQYLAEGRGSAWYNALNGRRHGNAPAASFFPRSSVRRIWGYSTGRDGALIVGADSQPAAARRAWALVADLMKRPGGARPAAAPMDLQAEAAYDTQQALDGLLGGFLAAGRCRSGWLGIRRGEQLSVAASKHSALPHGASFDLQTSPLLHRMREGRVAVGARKGSGDWRELPHALDRDARTWAAFPLLVADRFIGAIAVWEQAALSPGRLRQLQSLALQISRQVDLTVSFGEVTRQLHRLATLNEFALAISSAEELPQMAQRVLAHLGSMFPSYEIALYVPALDSQQVEEFRTANFHFSQRTAGISRHPIAALLLDSAADEDGVATRSSPQTPAGGTQLTLPLRYRGATVGALAVQGMEAPGLSRYDQSLLAVVASYMAGVVEHARLRAEALERARRLEDTVQRLQIAELTASTRLAAQQAAESRLVQAAKMVAVGEMAAGVAHELNNPLTTVSGFAELILDETPAEAPYRSDLEMVLHEARRARSVVRRLLDFARQGEHVLARADINEVVEDVLALMTHFVHTSGVQLEVELAQGLPWITLDNNQIKQVLLNLLHNALHAMPGGGRLQVRTELRQKDGRDWVVIHVTDNGVGIDAAELDRIFEPFYTTRAESGGTGLGLSVTYGIVSDHGGTIEVESQRGSGSTFSVWLPA